MKPRRLVLVLIPLIVAACDEDVRAAPDGGPIRLAVASEAPACEVVAAGMALPLEAAESSGLARSARDPAVFWTHNDAGNDPELFGVDETGSLVRRVRVTGAELVDWEDIAAAPCGEESCLYIGDIGDNDADRRRITVYRVVEPAHGALETAPAEPLHARYPDGAKDAEALFAAPSGPLYVVTKGRRAGISLYRWPPSRTPGQTVELALVRDLFPEPEDDQDRVTAASATPNGRWVGIRTYRTLYLYPTERLLGQGDPDPVTVDLTGLGQPQGESLVLADDGTAWLSSEAGGGGPPQWARLKCTLAAADG
jgi:hypothetical protein